MNKAWPQLAGLGDADDLQLIRWLGALTRNPTAEGQLHLEAIVASLKASKRPRSYPANHQLEAEHIAPFGIGDLPALSTVTYHEHGRQRYPIPMEQRNIDLDFTRQKQFRMRDSFGGTHPLRIFDIAERKYWNSVYPCSVTAVEHGGEPFGVLFPALEILRFAYGSSSALLQAVTDGNLAQVLEATRARASMQDGTFVIELPPGFQPEDAMTLAWLLRDDFARNSALHVHPSIATGTEQGRSYPQPRLPYEGKRSTTLQGRTVTGSDGQQRFLVHHILGIELPLGVQVGLAVAGEGAEGRAGGEALHAGRQLPDADARRSRVDSSSAPGQGTASARLPALHSQFSGVKPVRIARAPALGTAAAAPGAAVHSPPTPRGTFSTDPGHQPGSRAQRGTASVATPTRAMPVQADFTEIREVVRLLARKGYRTTERGPQTFPGTAEPVLVIEVEKGGQHRYLVERERSGDRSSGPLIVATLPHRRKASDAELARLLTLRTAKRVWLPHDPAQAWLLARVNHAYTSHQSFRDAILARF